MLNRKKKKINSVIELLEKNHLLCLGQQEGNMPAHPTASWWQSYCQSPVMTVLKFGLCTDLALPSKNSWLLSAKIVDLFKKTQQTYLLSLASALYLLKIKLLQIADHLSTDNLVSNWLHYYILFVCTVIHEAIKFLCLTFASEPVFLERKIYFCSSTKTILPAWVR